MDLPQVSQDPSISLPQVDPTSEQVPYRIGTKQPGGDYVYTTGYGARARPVQPPSGGGVGLPDLSQLYSDAFKNLPVEQAIQAIEAATQYIGQRGYMKDLQSGASAAQAFAKWGPMLFHRNTTGLSEAIKLQQPEPQPRQYPGMGVAYGGKFYPQKEDKPQASIALVDEIMKTTKEAEAAEASGNTSAAEQLRNRAELLSSQAKGGINMEFGPGGTLQSFSTGGPKSKPTIATASQAQAKLAQYQNATELMNWLETHITPQNVGLAGNVGEFAVDKTLAQLFPEAANKKRIDARSTLAMAQGLAREIVDSPSGRFSQQERDAVLGALPSTGVFESQPDAIARLQRAREVLRNRAKVYSEQVGADVPAWALTKDEIKDKFQRGKASGLKPTDSRFKKQGFLTQEEAADALQRFH